MTKKAKPTGNPKGPPATPKEIRAAIIAGLLAGQDGRTIAEQVGVSKQMVSKVKMNLRQEMMALREEWRFDVEVNLYKMVIGTQEAVLAQLKVLADAAWIQRQTAGELATLHGVLQDKVVRFLEAVQAASGDVPDAGNGELGAAVRHELHQVDEGELQG